MRLHLRTKFFYGILLLMLFALAAPAIAAADPVTQTLDLKLTNVWSADQSAGSAIPTKIEVGEASRATFSVQVNYQLDVSGSVYLKAEGPDSVNVTSWDIYLLKRISPGVWEKVTDKSGNYVKFQVIDEPTAIEAGSGMQFPVQGSFETAPIVNGDRYRWVTELQIEQNGQPDPTKYQVIQNVLTYYGP